MYSTNGLASPDGLGGCGCGAALGQDENVKGLGTFAVLVGLAMLGGWWIVARAGATR